MNRCLLAFYGFMTATFQFPDVAFRIYCITRLEYSPAVFAIVTSTSVLPWSIKPLWGFIIDNSSRRRLAIAMCTVGFIVAWLLIALEEGTAPWAMTTLLMTSSFCLCYMDVMADAELVVRVKKETEETAGALQSWVWGCRAAGSLLACIAGGFAATYCNFDTIFAITAFIIAPGSLALSVCITDKEPCGWEDVCRRVRLLRTTLKRREIYRPCVFVFTLAAMPSCYYALVSFFQETLHFTPMQFATVDAAEHVAHMLGATLFNKRFRRWKFTRIFAWGIGILFLLRLLQLVLILRLNRRLHVSDMVFAICESVAFSIVGQIMVMPICLLGARACPQGIEGSLYSTIMAISNLGGLLSAYSGAALTTAFGVNNKVFDNLWMLSLTCTMLSLVPFIFVRFMPNETPQSAGKGLELVNCDLQTGHDADDLQTQRDRQPAQNT